MRHGNRFRHYPQLRSLNEVLEDDSSCYRYYRMRLHGALGIPAIAARHIHVRMFLRVAWKIIKQFWFEIFRIWPKSSYKVRSMLHVVMYVWHSYVWYIVLKIYLQIR